MAYCAHDWEIKCLSTQSRARYLQECPGTRQNSEIHDAEILLLKGMVDNVTEFSSGPVVKTTRLHLIVSLAPAERYTCMPSHTYGMKWHQET